MLEALKDTPNAKMSRYRSRYWTKLSLVAALLAALWHFFSPWQIVLQSKAEIRQAALKENVHVKPTSESEPVASTDQIESKKDVIEQNFGELERTLLRDAKTSTNRNLRSRDDSIRLIYGIKRQEDWLNLVESHDSHGLMALTKVTQKYIHDKQNPSKCSGQKYLVLNHFPGDLYGIGALFQHIADYLSIAIQTNSILLYAEDQPPGQNFVSSPDEGGDKSCGRSLDCIFYPISKCKHEKQNGVKEGTQSIFVTPESGEIDLDVPAYLQKHGSAIPPVLEAALKAVQPDITYEMLKYWWRAQASAYLMRMNAKTSNRMKELRLGGGVKQLGMQWGTDGEPKDVEMPFPMPEGTISMHVRHGDKGSEMRLVPFNNYVVEAEKFGSVNPLGYWKRGFLSTENPNVIEQMQSMSRIAGFETSGSNSRWTWYWSDIPRLNTGPETQLAQFGDRTELTIKWMLQLVMAIECDAFVGTRGSGWNRLIDSLRCIWMASCKQPYLEVGFENDWRGYGP